jgi:parallel beta-helix repeat protein
MVDSHKVWLIGIFIIILSLGFNQVIGDDNSIIIAACGTPEGGWVSGQTYILNNDLTASGVCIRISEVDDITLDCQGHSITGDGTSFGFFVRKASNVTIKNCTSTNFDFGLSFYQADNCFLNDNNFNHNNKNGIYLHSSSNNALNNNNACDNSQSITGNYPDFRCLSGTNNHGTGNTFCTVTDCSSNGWPTENVEPEDDNSGVDIETSNALNLLISNIGCILTTGCESGNGHSYIDNPLKQISKIAFALNKYYGREACEDCTVSSISNSSSELLLLQARINSTLSPGGTVAGYEYSGSVVRPTIKIVKALREYFNPQQ